jgi:hypothetical protein
LTPRPHRRATSRSRPLAALPVALLALAGCGGALPLGHPAHVLSPGKTSLAAGVAGTVVLDSSTADSASSRLQDLSLAPEMSPWVAARAGLGAGFEGGLSASARAIRVDGRRSFETERLALSIGIGASALLAARPGGSDHASGVYGGGFDVPILAGWRSSADLYAVWLGPRVGAELFAGDLATGAGEPTRASGRHLRFGGLAGLRAGLRRLYGVIEVEASYHRADGTLGAGPVSLTGFTVAPAGALVVSF